MTDKDLDNLLKRKITEENMNSKVDMNAVFTTIKKNKNTKNSIISIAASFVVFVLIISSLVINNKLTKNENIEENSMIDNYGIIEVEMLSDNNEARISMQSELDERNPRKAFQVFSNLALLDVEYEYGAIIAKVNSLEYINYDVVAFENGENVYDYITPETIIDVDVNKVLNGNLDIQGLSNIHAKGGIIEYSEFMKYVEKNKYSQIDENLINLKYTELIQERKNKVFVSYFAKDRVKLEKDKTYLMFVTKKSNGKYYVETYNTLLLEYNGESNMVLLNNNWYPLEEVLY